MRFLCEIKNEIKNSFINTTEFRFNKLKTNLQNNIIYVQKELEDKIKYRPVVSYIDNTIKNSVDQTISKIRIEIAEKTLKKINEAEFQNDDDYEIFINDMIKDYVMMYDEYTKKKDCYDKYAGDNVENEYARYNHIELNNFVNRDINCHLHSCNDFYKLILKKNNLIFEEWKIKKNNY